MDISKTHTHTLSQAMFILASPPIPITHSIKTWIRYTVICLMTQLCHRRMR